MGAVRRFRRAFGLNYLVSALTTEIEGDIACSGAR
jgi:hypothetical protein